MKRNNKANKIFLILQKEYPDAGCGLLYSTTFELLVATILSAQCTDKIVNKVTPILFSKYPKICDMAAADKIQIENIVRPTGFYRNKANNIINAASVIINSHSGIVPNNMADLIALAGVGRKTANVVLGNAFDINEGIAVDTHVKRISKLLELSLKDDPNMIEQDLMNLFRRDRWTQISHLLIQHGRKTCVAGKPMCKSCVINSCCPYFQKNAGR